MDDFNIKAPTVGLSDTPSLSALSVFPNPSHGPVSLDLPNSDLDYTIQFINNFVSVISQFDISRSSTYVMDLSDYRKGSYFLRVISGEAIINK